MKKLLVIMVVCMVLVSVSPVSANDYDWRNVQHWQDVTLAGPALVASSPAITIQQMNRFQMALSPKPGDGWTIEAFTSAILIDYLVDPTMGTMVVEVDGVILQTINQAVCPELGCNWVGFGTIRIELEEAVHTIRFVTSEGQSNLTQLAYRIPQFAVYIPLVTH